MWLQRDGRRIRYDLTHFLLAFHRVSSETLLRNFTQDDVVSMFASPGDDEYVLYKVTWA